MSARNMAKRTAAGTLALAVCLGGGALALAGAAQADANFKFDSRIAGDDRYETAIAASKAAFPTDGKTENVVLVNGFATVDGLTASYLAGVANAPILYVSDKGADAKTQAEIKRLGVKNVWLVGGTTVIPQSVEDAMKVDYKVTRINGSDRYETAKMIAAKGAELSGKKPSKVLVASGTSFADALAVSPVAYAKGYAIALTEKDKTSDYTKDELKAIGADTKILVGGTAVVSDSVAKDLGVTKRVAGDDRAITANLVSDWAKSDEGFTKTQAALVGGTNGNGADSLVASSVLGKSMTTLHFAGWDATYTYLKDHAAELTGKGVVFGGKAAVNDDQVAKAQAAAQTIVSNQSIKVSTDAKSINVVSGSTTAKANTGSITYKVAVPSGAKSVNIGLYAAADVTSVDGKLVFKSKLSSLSASSGVSIETVNGAVQTPAAANGNTLQVATAPSSDGLVTFTVDSVNALQVVPVVWVDNGATSLKTLDFATDPTADAPQAPSEAFGAAEAQRWIPETFAGGTIAQDVEIDFVNKAEGYFTTKAVAAGGGGTPAAVPAATWRYDSNDNFKLSGNATPRGLDYFVARLTKGDVIKQSGTVYAPDAAQSSSFVLLNQTPAVTSLVTVAAKATTSGVQLTVGGVDTTVASTIKVYGALSSENVAVADAPLLATATKDADSDSGDFQINVGSLQADKQYDFYATITVDGEESDRFGASTTAPYQTNTLAAATAKATVAQFKDGQASTVTGYGVLGAGDTLNFTFDKAVTVGSTWSLTLRDAAGTEEIVDNTNSTAAISGADKTLLRVTIGSGGTTPVNSNSAIDLNTFQVSSATGFTNETGAWNLAASGDRSFGAGVSSVFKSAVLTDAGVASTTAVAVGATNYTSLASVTTIATLVTALNNNATFAGTYTASVGTGADAGRIIFVSKAVGATTGGAVVGTGGSTTAFGSGWTAGAPVALTAPTLTASTGVKSDKSFDIATSSVPNGVDAKVSIFTANGVLLGSKTVTAGASGAMTGSITGTAPKVTGKYVVTVEAATGDKRISASSAEFTVLS